MTHRGFFGSLPETCYWSFRPSPPLLIFEASEVQEVARQETEPSCPPSTRTPLAKRKNSTLFRRLLPRAFPGRSRKRQAAGQSRDNFLLPPTFKAKLAERLGVKVVRSSSLVQETKFPSGSWITIRPVSKRDVFLALPGGSVRFRLSARDGDLRTDAGLAAETKPS